MKADEETGGRGDGETFDDAASFSPSPLLSVSPSLIIRIPQSAFRNRLNLAQAPGERARGGGREVSERALALREAEARRERVADVEARA